MEEYLERIEDRWRPKKVSVQSNPAIFLASMTAAPPAVALDIYHERRWVTDGYRDELTMHIDKGSTTDDAFINSKFSLILFQVSGFEGMRLNSKT